LVQSLIDKHLARTGVFGLIAKVEAGEGIAGIPSFALPAVGNRKVVMSKIPW
jgi:hypothetical protein